MDALIQGVQETPNPDQIPMIVLPAPPELNINTPGPTDFRRDALIEDESYGKCGANPADVGMENVTPMLVECDVEKQQEESGMDGPVFSGSVMDSTDNTDPLAVNCAAIVNCPEESAADDTSFHSANGDDFPVEIVSVEGNDGSAEVGPEAAVEPKEEVQSDLPADVNSQVEEVEDETDEDDNLSVQGMFIDDVNMVSALVQDKAHDTLQELNEDDLGIKIEEDVQDEIGKGESPIKDSSVNANQRIGTRTRHNQKEDERLISDSDSLNSVEEVVNRPTRQAKTNPPSANAHVDCVQCGDRFSNCASLRAHFRVKHTAFKEAVISKCGKILQYIYCPLCSIRYQVKTAFVQHMYDEHSQSKHYFDKVDVYDADLLSTYMSTLKERVKAEPKDPAPEKSNQGSAECPPMHQCSFCTSTYNRQGNLYKHIMSKHRKKFRDVRKVAETTPEPESESEAELPPEPVRLPPAPRPKPQSKPKTRQSPPTSKAAPPAKVSPPAKVAAAPAKAASQPRQEPVPVLPKSLTCEWCRDRLKSVPQLNTHIRSKHSVPESMSADGINLPEFFTALEVHFYMYEKEENCYECVSCKETFFEKVGLLEHFSVEHLKSKVENMQIRLECSMCNHKESDVGKLIDHMWNEHANQKLEEVVMRVRDVRSNHRCGADCQLLWKKPVMSVEAAPREAVAQKRAASVTPQPPHPEKRKRVSTEVDILNCDDSDDDERSQAEKMMEQKREEANLLRKQKEEERKRKKREYYEKYKAAQLEKKANSKPATPLPSKQRCLVCNELCDDLQKHSKEVHSEVIGKRKSSRTPQSNRRLAETPSPPPTISRAKPRPSKSPAVPPSTQQDVIARCRNCKASFPDIVTMMHHQYYCTAPASGHMSAGPSQMALAQPVAAAKKPPINGQFVLMEEVEPAFNCKSCKVSYDTVSEWQAHIQEKHLDEFSCELCAMAFSDEARLSRHLIGAHNVGYPCVPCDTSFSNKKSFLRHVATNHKMNQSQFNGISLSNVDDILRIFEENGFRKPDERAPIVQRPYSFGSFGPPLKMESRDMPVMYQCELCNECFASQMEMDDHMEYVH